MPRHLPYSLKPEFVRGCTMRCVFCALRNQTWATGPAGLEQEYRFISRELWELYVQAVAVWRPKVRIEIANRGEPTVHPQFHELIAYARAHLPQAYILISTNGDLVERLGLAAYKEWIHEALKAGVNTFLLDCYTSKRLTDFTTLFQDEAIAFFDDERKDRRGFNPYPWRDTRQKALCIKDAVPKPVKENVILQYHNQGGNAVVEGNAIRLYPNIKVLNEPLQRMCVRPFREMPMWYDGSIPICCDDWADTHLMGRFPDKSLPELWEAYDDARRNLIAKNRGGQKPCDNCSEREGMRYGLELDWFAEPDVTAADLAGLDVKA